MNPVIEKEVFPLVGKVKWEGFDINSFGSLMSLKCKFIKHTQQGNTDKLKKYLAFCIQTWPEGVDDCPVDRDILDAAIAVIKNQ